jgi:hypothetical protein
LTSKENLRLTPQAKKDLLELQHGKYRALLLLSKMLVVSLGKPCAAIINCSL